MDNLFNKLVEGGLVVRRLFPFRREFLRGVGNLRTSSAPVAMS